MENTFQNIIIQLNLLRAEDAWRWLDWLDAKSNIYIKRPAKAWKMQSVKYTKDLLLTTV